MTVLSIDSARITEGHRVLAESLTFEARGPRVVLLGDATPIFATLAGRAKLATGTLCVLGMAPSELGTALGLAPRDPPLMLDLSPREHTTWSARLAGVPSPQAEAEADRVLSLAGLTSVASKPLRTLGLGQKRLTVLAAAAVASPRVLAAEAPLDGLDAAWSTYVLGALGRLVGDGAAIVSVSDASEGSAGASLAAGAHDVVELAQGRATVRGATVSSTRQQAAATSAAPVSAGVPASLGAPASSAPQGAVSHGSPSQAAPPVLRQPDFLSSTVPIPTTPRRAPSSPAPEAVHDEVTRIGPAPIGVFQDEVTRMGDSLAAEAGLMADEQTAPGKPPTRR